MTSKEKTDKMTILSGVIIAGEMIVTTVLIYQLIVFAHEIMPFWLYW